LKFARRAIRMSSLAKQVKTFLLSRRELPVEFFVAANPHPNPDIASKPLRDGAVIARHSHRPKTRVGSQALQLKGRMSWILKELLISGASG
jgi:hypothetical protein